MSTETHITRHNEVPIGPLLESGFFTTEEERLGVPHSGVHHDEGPVTEFDSSLQNAVDKGYVKTKAPKGTGGLPTELQNITRREKSWKKPAAIAAVGIAGVAAAAFTITRGGEDEVPVTKPPAATSSPTGGASPESVTPTTPPTTEVQGELTATKVAEALTPSRTLYSPETMSSLALDANGLDTMLAKHSNLYPDLNRESLSKVVAEQGVSFEALTAESLRNAQERFNRVLESTTYDEASLTNGNPRLVSLGEYFTTGAHETRDTFPVGLMKPGDITEYNKISKGLPTEQGTASVLTQRIEDSTRLIAPLTWLVGNEEKSRNFIKNMTEEQRNTVLLPSGTSLELYKSLFINDQNMNDVMQVLDNAADPNHSYATCQEGYVVGAQTREIPYGPTTIPVNSLTLACEQPGAKQFVVFTVVPLPVDAYQQGRRIDQPVLQPFVLEVDTFDGIR